MPMNERYEPQALEPKWQPRWEESGLFRAGRRPGAPKKYILEMLPYPSGKMHMGHVRNYLIGDVLARYFAHARLRRAAPHGLGRLRPAGGERGHQGRRAPGGAHRREHQGFKAEIKSLGYAYDWTREVNTCEPEYYRWNQWFFLKMLERGLVYRRFSRVNWCTGCLTVIANEQVKDGRCERCDSAVAGPGHARVGVPHHPRQPGAAGQPGHPDRAGPSASSRRSATGSAAPRAWRRTSGWRAAARPCASSPPASTPSSAAPTWCWRPSTALAQQIAPAEQAPQVEAFVSSMAAMGKEQRRARTPRRRASSPAPTRSTPSPASRCRCGSPTSCSPTTAPAR